MSSLVISGKPGAGMSYYAARQIIAEVCSSDSRVKKSQKRFSIGQRVTFKVWEGSTIQRFGSVAGSDRKCVHVNVDGIHSGPVLVRRCAVQILPEGGK